MNGIDEFVASSLSSNSVEALFELYQSSMADLGFDRVLLSLLTDHPHLKKEAEHGIVRNYPATWFAHYMDQGYDQIDPVRDAVLAGNGVFTWQDLKDRIELSPKQQLMFDEAEDAKLYSGIGVTLHGEVGSIAGIGAASTEKDFLLDAVTLHSANLLSQQFFACFCQLMRVSNNQIIDQNFLSAKEREVLKWMATGLSKAKVADRLCMSSHTVSFHVRNINKKFGVKNVTASVAKAVAYKLITI